MKNTIILPLLQYQFFSLANILDGKSNIAQRWSVWFMKRFSGKGSLHFQNLLLHKVGMIMFLIICACVNYLLGVSPFTANGALSEFRPSLQRMAAPEFKNPQKFGESGIRAGS
jgi:hypothetical protein